MGTGDTDTSGQRADHQRFLPERRDKQERIFLLAQRKLRESACTELVKKEELSIAPGGWVWLASEPMQQTTEALAIEINGCHITVTAETDQGLLAKICHPLRSL